MHCNAHCIDCKRLRAPLPTLNAMGMMTGNWPCAPTGPVVLVSTGDMLLLVATAGDCEDMCSYWWRQHKQGWQGRWGARGVGRKKAAPLAGCRVLQNLGGSKFAKTPTIWQDSKAQKWRVYGAVATRLKSCIVHMIFMQQVYVNKSNQPSPSKILI